LLLLRSPALRSRAQRPRLRRAAARALQELTALIKYIQLNKASDSDWFTITSNKEGTHWSGKCWYVHNLLRHEFAFEFDIPATYPATAPEIRIPELDGKTAKMYRGGAICLTVHFKPLWAKNRRVRAAAHMGSCKPLCCQTCVALKAGIQRCRPACELSRLMPHAAALHRPLPLIARLDLVCCSLDPHPSCWWAP